MTYIELIAYHQGRRDEAANQDLAKDLIKNNNQEGFDEIASYLYDKNKSIASDCLKVLYEAGYHKPEMMLKYLGDFLKLLDSSNNRMVWGAMIALWNLADIASDEIFEHIDLIMSKTETGTTITHVTGIKVMLVLAGKKKSYYDRLYPTLIRYLEVCRPIDFAKRLEDYMVIFNDQNREAILKEVYKRFDHLNKNQSKRVKKALTSKGIDL